MRTRTDILDSVGNTTAATGKGLQLLAALTSLALFQAYVTFTGIDGINIFKAPVLAMLFVGGMIPVVFLCFSNEFCWKSCNGYGVRSYVASSKKFQELWKELEDQNTVNVWKFQQKPLYAK